VNEEEKIKILGTSTLSSTHPI
jgi:hypothetical protein